MHYTIEVEQEADGRWIAEVLELPGALAYGDTPAQAQLRLEALTLRILAEQLEHGETAPHPIHIDLPALAP